jgi:hypothetical protein
MGTLADTIVVVRQDLQDVGEGRWSDAVLGRHIERAVLEYSQVSPLEKKNTIALTVDTRTLSLTTLTSRVRVTAAEYPVDEWPLSLVAYSEWAAVLTLHLDAVPGGTPNANVYWEAVHTINGTTSYPRTHDDMIAGGAAGYASLEWASFASNRLNVGGDEVWGRYQEFANTRLAAFREQLARLPAANRMRTGRLYAGVERGGSTQLTDAGP